MVEWSRATARNRPAVWAIWGKRSAGAAGSQLIVAEHPGHNEHAERRACGQDFNSWGCEAGRWSDPLLKHRLLSKLCTGCVGVCIVDYFVRYN